MKIKITSTYALMATALAVLVSSCGSNVTVAKRYHSGGFNFSYGGGSDGEKAVAKATAKKPVIKYFYRSCVCFGYKSRKIISW